MAHFTRNKKQLRSIHINNEVWKWKLDNSNIKIFRPNSKIGIIYIGILNYRPSTIKEYIINNLLK
jgi:hypothetical protein